LPTLLWPGIARRRTRVNALMSRPPDAMVPDLHTHCCGAVPRNSRSPGTSRRRRLRFIQIDLETAELLRKRWTRGSSPRVTQKAKLARRNEILNPRGARHGVQHAMPGPSFLTARAGSSARSADPWPRAH
jgi:hypothetical protein